MVWHLLKYLVSFFIGAFYKRVQAKNIKNLQVKGPVIIAMNHPNAFTDPVCFTYVSYPTRLKYLARGDAFKPGPVSWLLEQIGIVPIFRIQDGGKEGLKKNDDAYRRVNYLLKHNAKIMVFAEGLCIQERRLRPLKKGVARMVFGAYEALNNDTLVVVPVGVNYSKPDKFRSTLFYNIGEPIPVKDFMADYANSPARANNLFLQALEPKMKALITHIDKPENDEVVYQVEELCKKDLLKEQGLNYKSLADDYEVTRQITGRVNKAAETNQALLDGFKAEAKAYLSDLRSNGLRDWLIDPKQNKGVTPLFLGLRYLFIILGFPLYLTGLIGNYLPMKLTRTLVKKMVKNREFYSSFSIALGMVFFLLNYILWFVIVYLLSPGIFMPLLVCFSFALCAWFSLYFHPFIKKTGGAARALKHKALTAQFARRRETLLSLINKF